MKNLVIILLASVAIMSTSCKSTSKISNTKPTTQTSIEKPNKTENNSEVTTSKALKTANSNTSKVGTVMKGGASYYADKYEGRPTASGESFSQKKLTAAHKTLKFGTMVRVTNLSNNKKVEVKINDRGPYVNGRIIDLSRAAAEKIDLIKSGVAEVTVEIIKEP